MTEAMSVESVGQYCLIAGMGGGKRLFSFVCTGASWKGRFPVRSSNAMMPSAKMSDDFVAFFVPIKNSYTMYCTVPKMTPVWVSQDSGFSLSGAGSLTSVFGTMQYMA